MGQADPLAARCGVKGCREQEILFWLAPCGMVIVSPGKSCPMEEKGGKERMKKRGGQTFLFRKRNCGVYKLHSSFNNRSRC
jgi:hypothetical protein